MGIINNGTAFTLSRFKSKYPIDKNFDIFISSAIEGIKKPDQKIFLLAAKKLRTSPENCLFIDDSFKNIEGAKKVGMKTILWKDKKGF